MVVCLTLSTNMLFMVTFKMVCLICMVGMVCRYGLLVWLFVVYLLTNSYIGLVMMMMSLNVHINRK